MEPTRQDAAIAVVSSFVARGAVGGRGATFALERLGFPVWWVPTVILPWHPGQGPGTRILPPAADFDRLLADLEGSRHRGEIAAILTGYIGDIDQIAPIARLITRLKESNSDIPYLCDPVIGDVGGLFRPEPLAEEIRRELLPLADMTTPNRYEVQWLDGKSAHDNAGLTEAACRLGPAEVVVTSAFAAPGAIANLCVTSGSAITEPHAAQPRAPRGTGDLFAALYLGHRLNRLSPQEAMRQAARATAGATALAATCGADELPIAAAQDRFAATVAEIPAAAR